MTRAPQQGPTPGARPRSALENRDGLDTSTLVAGVVCSMLLHGVIVGFVIVGTWHKSSAIEEELEQKVIEFEEVQLLALGEQKPPNQLPRIANPAPAVVKPDEVNLARPNKKVEAKPKPEPEDKKPEKVEKEERKKRMLDALSDLHDPMRPTNDELPEGDAAGVVGGTVSDAALANMMGTYQAKLVSELSRRWTVPSTIPREEIDTLQGRLVVYIRLSDQGNVVSYRLKKKSGNDQFDDSVERLLQKFEVSGGGARLPLPDQDEVKALVLKQGLNLKKWAYTGQ